MEGFDREPVTYRVVTNPLTGFLAYWHACTGTPYEEQTRDVPLTYDRGLTDAGIRLGPRRELPTFRFVR